MFFQSYTKEPFPSMNITWIYGVKRITFIYVCVNHYDFILYAIIRLFIKNYFFNIISISINKIDKKLVNYLNNYLFIINKYNL
jgi:hypothetical protein